MIELKEAYEKLIRRMEGQRMVTVLLVQQLTEDGAIDMERFIGSLRALERDARRENAPSETIEEVRMAADLLEDLSRSAP